MNALKKIFLLTLLSVFFLSAFSQTFGSAEVLATININKSADPGAGFEINTPDEGIQMWPYWWFLYRVVQTEVGPGYATVTCIGGGFKLCMARLSDLWNKLRYNDIQIQEEVLEATCEDLTTNSEELIANGVYNGSLSKKIAIPNDRTNYILFKMNWRNDPNNPYNGQAEIIISKTDRLGF